MALILLLYAGEDEEDQLMRCLRSTGHDIIVCKDRWEAIRRSTQTPIDLALVDFAHPDVTGVEVILQLRKSAPNAAIIAMSPDAHEANYGLLRLAASAGATTVLPKPANTEEILQTIEAVLQRRSSDR